jgi:hypothetical protein
MALRQKQLNASINNTGNGKVLDQQTPPLPPSKRSGPFDSANFKKRDSMNEKSEKSIETKA